MRVDARRLNPDGAAGHSAAGRIRGIDAARAVAIVGMVMVHFGPDDEGGALGRLYGFPSGRAVILFVLLAGVGVSLLAGDRSAARRRDVWSRLGFRAAVLLPAGLALQLLDHGALVILQHYALLFFVAAGAVALGERALLVVALVAVVVGPTIYLGALRLWPEPFAQGPAVITDPPLFIARDLLLTGAYPILTFTGPLLIGMWLGRREPTLRRVRWLMVAVGALLAGASWLTSRALIAWLGHPTTEPSWTRLVLDGPHSQMPLWLLGSIGSATAVIGIALVAVDRWPRATWPLVAMGQLALTIYVAHLLMLALWPGLLVRADAAGAAVSAARFALGAALVSVVWRARLARGPLEAALRGRWALAP